MPGLLTDGYQTVDPGVPSEGSYNAVTGYELIASDTQRSGGAAPQSVAMTPFQIAAMAAGMSVNTTTASGTGSTSTATLNVYLGRVISDAITTAAGATHTLTLTNSTVAATSEVQVSVYSLANTGATGLTITSVTPAAGSVVIAMKNNGAAAVNGTVVWVFQVKAT